jgi:Uracil DNA glycosylase superfamily
MPKSKSAAARERLRRSCRPRRVRLLFVGEAPPASGRFFYQEDSGLYRAVREAFIAARPSIADSDFLAAFGRLGCYLVDLCGMPVDRLGQKSRTAARLEGEARLSKSIRRLNPSVIITLTRSIAANVCRAQAKAGWKGEHIELPYPGRWHRHKTEFLRILIPRLRAWMNSAKPKASY